jgi:predicted Zn-dependent protease
MAVGNDDPRSGCRASVLLLVMATLSVVTRSESFAAEPRARKINRAAKSMPAIPFAPDSFIPNFFGENKGDQALTNMEVSLTDERQLGDSMTDAYLADLQRQRLKVRNRGLDVEYLKDLADTLRPFMTNKKRYPKIRIYVIDSPQTDARSFPGGTLFFFRGLLEFAGSEAALSGIVGHELSHVDHGHQLSQLKRLKLFEQSTTGGPGETSPERMMSAISAMAHGFARPFRPEDESEADNDGATWAFKAGYDPREMARLFMDLHHRDANRQALAPSFFRTHPFHIDRYHAIRAQFVGLQGVSPARKLYIGHRNLKERTSRAKRAFDDEWIRIPPRD